MSGLRAAAINYARMGWPVFPLAPKAKVPLVPIRAGGRGLHDATTDLAQIAQWWNNSRRANIGLRTGIAFDVVDIDGPQGEESFASLGIELDGPVVVTGKGRHHYIAATGEGNRAGLLPGVDFRGSGGYVIGPPSVHPEGPVYAWLDGRGPTTSLPEAPEKLIDLLRPPRPPRPPGTPLRVIRGGMGDTSRYAQAALEDELATVARAAVGTRNHTLYSAAKSLGQLCGARLLEVLPVVEMLLQAARAAGLDEREAEATITSGMKNGMAKPRQVAQ